MKNFITALIAIGIIATIFFFLGKGCSKSQGILDNSRELELLGEIKSLRYQNATLNAERDSLIEVTKRKIPAEIVRRENEIDQNIAKDSSNSIVEFRKALVENNELPDGTEYPTYREFGLSAKLMAKVPKMELQIKGYDEIILKDNEIISNLNFQIEANEDLREIQRLAIINCERQLEQKDSFSDDRLIGYGGIGVSYGADGKLQPTVQLGVGVRIITIWR